MATTSKTLVTGQVLAGQGGNGGNGRFGLRATLAAGVAILGCAAVLAFGGVQMNQAGRTQPQTAPPAVQATAGTDDLATIGCIGTAGPFACATTHSGGSYQDLIWELESAVGERVNGPATGGPVGQAGTLSGGSYADTIWELENVVGERVNVPAATAGTLSGGSYQDLVWELDQAIRAATR